MDFSVKGKNIAGIYGRRESYNLRPDYQRGLVWSRERQQLLIDSILRKYDIPKIYIARNQNIANAPKYDVVDGQQRLTAIFQFCSDELELGDNITLAGADLAGRTYSQLPEELQEEFDDYQLSISEIRDASVEEIHKMFLRLQEGVSLNPAEKRNAMICDIRDSVVRLAEHDLFNYTIKPKDQRYLYQDWAAHLACIENHGGATEVNAAGLMAFYENAHVKASAVERSVHRILNKLYSCFDKHEVEPMLDIKWGLVDLYQLVRKLDKEFVWDEDMACAVSAFYRLFEYERRKSNKLRDPKELLEPGYSGEFPGTFMFDYRESFQREGHKVKNLNDRLGVYVAMFFYFISVIKEDDVVITPKDTKRAFDSDERLIIWIKASETCQSCSSKIRLEEMHADHILPFSKGGMTSLANAQCLCGPCNLAKSDRIK